MTDHGHTLEDWEHNKEHVRALTLNQITQTTGLAVTSASRIKTGKQIPHPRHWSALFTTANPSVPRSSDQGSVGPVTPIV